MYDLAVGLVVEIVSAPPNEDVGRGVGAPTELAFRRSLGRWALLLPVEPVVAGRVPDVGQVPVAGGDGVGGLVGPDGRRAGAAAGVPHVIPAVDAEHLGGIAARDVWLAREALEPGVPEVAEELVAPVLARVPYVVQSVHGGAELAVGRLLQRHLRGERLGVGHLLFPPFQSHQRPQLQLGHRDLGRAVEPSPRLSSFGDWGHLPLWTMRIGGFRTCLTARARRAPSPREGRGLSRTHTSPETRQRLPSRPVNAPPAL